ncbi:apolipoprotein N-acyltransferase [Albitalea terrae]|uniref:Apolipoprotein N-acyltransferase n=2 Tax=Piscinibacter terrae TaxID=2496871 RepID=A0A3N7I053_9BURK|nr:apolipoprotein N-acyltransferase [Albitalea terrae]
MMSGVLASALVASLYARGGVAWVLGFVALVPWLRTLDATRTMAGALLSGYAMSVAFTLAVFGWFGSAIGNYTQLGSATGLVVLLVAAPLFQPQFIVFAFVRQWAARWHGAAVCALAGAAAWVAAEWCMPKMLGDTLAYGLYPSKLLRQAADVGGAAGLTFAMLLANESVRAALAHRGDGLRAMARPLALAALVPALLAGYGLATLSSAPAASGKPLRMGLVQSNIVDYERLRREKGAGAVVREVLDTHYAMSHDAVERQHADAVLWSETVYPTTFGHPKSEAGAELDREILGIVNAANVPFVFGTYDRDDAGEYNAAAFVVPGSGLLGFYRKTRLFPLTEYVPAWLDGPVFRRWFPWTGSWQPGTGARVFPLRLRDGREIPVLPLICLDDMDAALAIDGARLGGQAILTLSNDSWFSDDPLGAELHQAAAAFRSIETRLPQFRVTSNGYSGVIDATGTVIAATRMGERTLVIGDVPVREAPRTLMLMWGDWVGKASAVFLLLLALTTLLRCWHERVAQEAPGLAAQALPASVAILPAAARITTAVLRVFSRGSLLWMVAAVLLGDGVLQANPLAQIRMFAALFLAPEAAAWFVLLAFSARASIDGGALVLARGSRRLELPIGDIASADAWRLPIPGPGVSLRLNDGRRWRYGLAHHDPLALAQALADAVGAPSPQARPSRASAYAQAREAVHRGLLDRPLAKFIVLPLMLTIPAFRLHQHIAYGGSFGEYQAFGLSAYLTTFALWWAGWVIGVVLCAAALRAAIEAGTMAAVMLRPAQVIGMRRWLERLGTVALYLGLPSWLLMRIVAS